ncbi:hypothetical protein B0H14DRAFT_3485549 [Mycena olivaceomarginata]|nr:hypothetical protein B0H14DRAFT_3485549 [Mycena olivaceomarginata]
MTLIHPYPFSLYIESGLSLPSFGPTSLTGPGAVPDCSGDLSAHYTAAVCRPSIAKA